jgi:two-component system, response regulator YesN
MYKAIIVDDEALVREAVQMLAKWSEFDITMVFEASNAIEALSIIQREAPRLIITDMKMPGMDGVQFLKRLQELPIRCRVLVISGFQDYEYTRQAIRSNVVDYILKPIDGNDLNDAISTAMALIEDEDRALEQDPSKDEPSLAPSLIREIERYVKDNYNRELGLDALSRRFFISKEHISRSFKKEFGMNLFDFVADLRIRSAKDLMRRTSLSIEEVARRVGYSNGSYFSKAFRKSTNMTPSEFRAGDLKDQE